MNILYASIYKTLEYQSRIGVIPEVNFQWGNNSAIKPNNRDARYPIVQFNLQGIEFDNPSDKFPIGNLQFTLTIKLEISNNVNTLRNFDKEFNLIKKMPTILNAVQTEETGPIEVIRIEELHAETQQLCFTITCATQFYPPHS